MNNRPLVVCSVIVVGALLLGASPDVGRSSPAEHQRQVETVRALCRIGQAIEEFSIDHGEYPRATSIGDLVEKVVPRYVDDLPTTDSWGNELSIISVPTQYLIASCGKGASGGCTPAMINDGGEMSDPRRDIILNNGVFLQWPAGLLEVPDGSKPSCLHFKDQPDEYAVAHIGSDAT